MTRQYVCPACGATNRLPDQRDPSVAKCGKCREALFSGAPLEVTGAGLAKHRRDTRGGAVLVDVWAPWCGPCRSFAPIYLQAAAQLQGRCRLAKLDSEANPQLSAEMGIRSIPTLILLKGGVEVARQSGALPLPQLLGWLRQQGI